MESAMFEGSLVGEYVFFARENDRGYSYITAGTVVSAAHTEKGYIKYQMADLFDGRIVSDKYQRISLAIKGASERYKNLVLLATPDKKYYVFLDKNGLPHNPSIKATNVGVVKSSKYFFTE